MEIDYVSPFRVPGAILATACESSGGKRAIRLKDNNEVQSYL